MRIVIVGGGVKVDFLATSLIKKKHQLVIIDLDQDKCQALSEKSNAVIICGDGTKPFILEDAGVAGFDLMIAVTSKDADNLVICQLAKKMFGIRRAFATVNNPRNVEVFKKLGINTAVSATYVLAGIIEQMAFTDQIVHAMPLEEGKLQLLEVIVEEGHRACGKQIMDLDFPKDAIIGCIVRGSGSVIPNGRTEIHAGDKLMIFTSLSSQEMVLACLIGDVQK